MNSKGVKKMANSATAIIINTNRTQKGGKAAIYLRVIIGRKIKYINLDIS